MHIQFAPARPADARIVALPVEKDGLERVGFGSFDAAVGQVAIGAARLTRFDGEAGTVAESFAVVGGEMVRLLLVGIGGGSEVDYERAGGALTAKLLTSGAESVVVDFSALGGMPTAVAAARFAAGAAQRSWRLDVYRTKLPEKSKPTLNTVTLCAAPPEAEAAWQGLAAVTSGLELTRTLVAEPANIIYPVSFVERVKADVEGLGLEISVLGEAEMTALGMGALLGVSQGSVREAQLLVLKWSGKGPGDPDVALVGKGVTFDTGGISLKPGPGMDDDEVRHGRRRQPSPALMHVTRRCAKPRSNVVGICGLVENMPDGKAQRPGDVVKSMSGQTIEILNTDAEGRLVLCRRDHLVLPEDASSRSSIDRPCNAHWRDPIVSLGQRTLRASSPMSDELAEPYPRRR